MIPTSSFDPRTSSVGLHSPSGSVGVFPRRLQRALGTLGTLAGGGYTLATHALRSLLDVVDAPCSGCVVAHPEHGATHFRTWDLDDDRPDSAEAVSPPVSLYDGTALGPLIGGNLDTLLALLPTPYMPDLEGAILFWEVAFSGHRVPKNQEHGGPGRPEGDEEEEEEEEEEERRRQEEEEEEEEEEERRRKREDEEEEERRRQEEEEEEEERRRKREDEEEEERRRQEEEEEERRRKPEDEEEEERRRQEEEKERRHKREDEEEEERRRQEEENYWYDDE